MTNTSKMQMIIQPKHTVIRDMMANRRWIVALVIAIIVFVVISAAIFRFLEPELEPGNANNDWLNSVYFTVINITTVGFGDIVPRSSGAKLLAIVNSLVGVVIFGLMVAVIAAAFQPSEFAAECSVDSPLSLATTHTPKTSKEGAVMLLNGLGALLGNAENADTHTRISLILDAQVEDRKDHIIIDVHVFTPHGNAHA